MEKLSNITIPLPNPVIDYKTITLNHPTVDYKTTLLSKNTKQIQNNHIFQKLMIYLMNKYI